MNLAHLACSSKLLTIVGLRILVWTGGPKRSQAALSRSCRRRTPYPGQLRPGTAGHTPRPPPFRPYLSRRARGPTAPSTIVTWTCRRTLRISPSGTPTTANWRPISGRYSYLI